MAFEHTCARGMTTRAHRLVAFAPAVLMLAVAVGCAGSSTRVPVGTLEPDKFLFEHGTTSLNDKKWFTAREFFRTLVDTYPQSPFRADAKLGIGDSYLGEGGGEGFVLAENEYREFLNFYPTHRRADYAHFKLAMTHFYQMHGPERDQSKTRDAIKELTAFLERFPNSELRPEAQKQLRIAKDRLSESEYRVGYFYFRTQKWYPGAIDRFIAVLRNDPEYTGRDAVYYYLAESLMKVERPAEALPYYDKLIAEFEVSEYLADSQKRSSEIKALMAAAVKKQ
jgi:outer membrane protein assembly factor BamD